MKNKIYLKDKVMFMKSKYKILSIIIISIVLVSTMILIRNSRNIEELQQIKSKSELQRILK